MEKTTSDSILGVIRKESWILDHFEIFVNIALNGAVSNGGNRYPWQRSALSECFSSYYWNVIAARQQLDRRNAAVVSYRSDLVRIKTCGVRTSFLVLFNYVSRPVIPLTAKQKRGIKPTPHRLQCVAVKIHPLKQILFSVACS